MLTELQINPIKQPINIVNNSGGFIGEVPPRRGVRSPGGGTAPSSVGVTRRRVKNEKIVDTIFIHSAKINTG